MGERDILEVLIELRDEADTYGPHPEYEVMRRAVEEIVRLRDAVEKGRQYIKAMEKSRAAERELIAHYQAGRNPS